MVKYLLQKRQHAGASSFKAHRNHAEKIGQQHSHFRIIIRKFVHELLLLKGWYKTQPITIGITENRLESAFLESAHPSHCFIDCWDFRNSLCPLQRLPYFCLYTGCYQTLSRRPWLTDSPSILGHLTCVYLPLLPAHIYQRSQNNRLQLAQARPHDDYHMPSTHMKGACLRNRHC